MDLISRQDAIDAVEFGITYAKAINKSTGEVKELFKEGNKALNEAVERIKDLPSAQPEPMSDLISRQAAIDLIERMKPYHQTADDIAEMIHNMPSAQPDSNKYEYHYDHTDCIWYRPEARNRCPVTCAQYRDGWNDAMNYIFRNGKGYRPYRRNEQYGE